MGAKVGRRAGKSREARPAPAPLHRLAVCLFILLADVCSRFPAPLALSDRLALQRTRLANERTLLTYVRTSLALVGFGLALIQLHPVRGGRLGYVALAGVVLTVGLL
ncbi:hypothetical protein AXW84_19710 [Hymenobacter sp. PAMC 26628]|nr:hypothetical protein AXW84_19710 [Hymenobacter sp. PAMC 26628]